MKRKGKDLDRSLQLLQQVQLLPSYELLLRTELQGGQSQRVTENTEQGCQNHADKPRHQKGHRRHTHCIQQDTTFKGIQNHLQQVEERYFQRE